MKNIKPSKSGALSNSFMDKNELEYLFGNACISGAKSLAIIAKKERSQAFLRPHLMR